jgi:hypothetical protein
MNLTYGRPAEWPLAWWLASVAQERQTAQRIADAGFLPVLFMCEQHCYRRGRYVPKFLAPLYSNYLFIHASGDPCMLKPIRGVIDLVRAEEGEVAEVRDSEVESRQAIGRREGDYCWVLGDVVAQSKFKQGDEIEVNNWHPGRHRVAAVLGDGFVIVEMMLFGRMVQARVREADCHHPIAEKRSGRIRPRSKHRSSSNSETPQYA